MRRVQHSKESLVDFIKFDLDLEPITAQFALDLKMLLGGAIQFVQRGAVLLQHN